MGDGLPSSPQLAEMNVEKLMKMAGSVRTGGKGTMRRIGVNAIPAIEEVNIFKEDVVIQFTNPKVQASIAANTWVVSGSPQTKKLQDVLPQIIHQLGPDNLENLKKLAEQFKNQMPGAAAGAAAAEEQDDDDVPDLVDGETFEAAAEEVHVHDHDHDHDHGHDHDSLILENGRSHDLSSLCVQLIQPIFWAGCTEEFIQCFFCSVDTDDQEFEVE
ncbi:unnamed protein product [Fraxinus pennsylvanica]|uniref:Nascent polypeptide-associated complex subunit beta n=1 Tax=Fraxinus pennsylvanica TaxID=56036 RepID=A0AAD1ZBD4_9LAMI|nr:unnamed protein product [Fraxinus pennsylvanica]